MARNLTNLELDFVDDLGGSTKIARENEHIIGKCKTGIVENLGDEDYALVFMTKQGSDGRFPLKTKEQALLSCFYIEKNASKLPKAMIKVASTRLKGSCEKHGVPVSSFIEAEAGDGDVDNHVSPYVHEQSKFAYENRYPINTPEQVKTAVEYFNNNHKHFKPDQAFTFCNNVISSAKENHIKIARDSRIMDYCQGKYSNLIKVAVSKRVGLLDGIYEYGDSEGDAIKLSYKKLLDDKGNLKPIEFCEKLAHIDKVAGIDSHWDKGSIDNPYVATFKRYDVDIVKVGSKVITKDQILRLCETEKFAGLFSADFKKGLVESPLDVFNSLPTPDKKLIASMIEE